MEHKYTNRLIHETSPYLLQHANPSINAWGDEAFERPRQKTTDSFEHRLFGLPLVSCRRARVL
jgi:hypothetical protein